MALIGFTAAWFVAGVIGTLLGHQILLTVLHGIGFAPFAPWQMQPVQPLGVPQLVSTAFWGGVWGIVLGLVSPLFGKGLRYWLLTALFGAVAPTLVAVAVVLPLKDMQPTGDPVAGLVTGLAVNAAWALVTVVSRRLFRR
ncbi:hypothetical protein [Minwuia thermotolerans]|uniref:Uncharacterized protein n=1 Tax=Minwuia thermotolerans TaxID=2056226 RepID=A0A2M9FX92_9PROT|nr:hypothetical protein [Minwuia thermotolerans]PJK28059.1 hypothetical protein CVT23_18645 [Minwuia thermotolerans]